MSDVYLKFNQDTGKPIQPLEGTVNIDTLNYNMYIQPPNLDTVTANLHKFKGCKAQPYLLQDGKETDWEHIKWLSDNGFTECFLPTEYNEGGKNYVTINLPSITYITDPSVPDPHIYNITIRYAGAYQGRFKFIFELPSMYMFASNYVEPVTYHASQFSSIIHDIFNELPDDLKEYIHYQKIDVPVYDTRWGDPYVSSYPMLLCSSDEVKTILPGATETSKYLTKIFPEEYYGFRAEESHFLWVRDAGPNTNSVDRPNIGSFRYAPGIGEGTFSTTDYTFNNGAIVQFEI